MPAPSFTVFGYGFSERVLNYESELLNLEREGVLYEQWILDDDQGGSGLYRVTLTPAEIFRYVRGIIGWDEYLGGGLSAVSDRALATEVASSAQQRAARDPEYDGPWPVDFLGGALEDLVCGGQPGRAEKIRPATSDRDALAVLHEIAASLPTSIKSLTDRGALTPFAVESERDLQDVLLLILRSIFQDTRREDWTPSAAGNAKRIDIVIPSARLLVETKFVRDRRHAKRIADELRVDIESYHHHPACGTFFGFVWDPQRFMDDPAQLEQDLSAPRTKGDASFDVVLRVV
jgi:hypothetical protein